MGCWQRKFVEGGDKNDQGEGVRVGHVFPGFKGSRTHKRITSAPKNARQNIQPCNAALGVGFRV